MNERLEPGGIARRLLLRRVFGVGIVVVIGSRAAEAADMQIVIDNFTFSPTPLTVKAGTTVTFTNAGDTPHTATAFENGKFGGWDTGVLNSGESKTVSFDKPGSYYYICTPHPWMYGQVIVE